VLGWSAEELMSDPQWEFLHPDDQPDVVEPTDRELSHGLGSRYGYAVRMLCRDSTYRQTRWTARAGPAEDLLYAVAIEIALTLNSTGGRWKPVRTNSADFRVVRPDGTIRSLHAVGRHRNSGCSPDACGAPHGMSPIGSSQVVQTRSPAGFRRSECPDQC